MSDEDEPKRRTGPRFHGRVSGTGQVCAQPGCTEPGEFRAPPLEGSGGPKGIRGDTPQPFRWLCLDHVRAFNSRYNFFDGMTADEIHHAQHPIHGWERETRAFAANAGDRPPRWADFADPLEAIQGRFGRAKQAGRKDGKPLTPGDRKALETLGLGIDASLREVRARYSELVRRYHPDRNGGDRGHEAKLGDVIAAWQLLRKSAIFA